MPSAKPASRSSPATAHETVLEVAEQELCLGAVDVLWRAPIRTADSEKQNEDEIEEEDEDYAASTIRTRLQGHGPGPSRSFISSRHINSYDYGEGASSYLPRGSESHSRATSNFDHQASNVDPNHLHQYSYTTPSISVSRLSHNPSHLSVPDFPPESLSHGAQEDVRLEPSLQPPPTGQEYLDVARSSHVTNDTLSQVGTTDGEAGYEGDLEHRNTLRPKTRGHTTTYV
ncbi:hypothetical protein FRC20_008481 [Serendipita sp. 405]|nr:hypothetical protein FRC20_008481 [Serendipita sp. 405]